MKITITTKMKDFDGENLKEGGKEITIKTIMVNSLLTNEKNIDGKKKFTNWQLAKRIHSATKQVELSAEEATLIKDQIALGYSTIVVGQTWEILNGK